MKTTALTLATILGLSATSVLAETMVEDTDGSGGYSMEELMTAWPNMTDELFAQLDVDASGEVSADELTAAKEAGLIVE